MNISRRTVAKLDAVYSIAVLPQGNVRQPGAFLAGSDAAGPLLFFEPPDYEPRLIADRPGGFVSICPLITASARYVLATVDFMPGFNAANCRINLYPLDEGASPEPFEVAQLPYTHRVAVANVGSKNAWLGSTLCEKKEFKQDWTHPGGIHVAEIPDPPSQPWKLRQVFGGINKNHGMDYAKLPHARNGGFLLSAMEGLFYLHLPDDLNDDWPCEQITSGEHSDALAYDWRGAGFCQIFSLSPFHGNVLTIYEHSGGGWQPTVIADDIEFAHVLWAGELLGQPALLIGGRQGREELRLYRKAGADGSSFEYDILDEGIGPTQVAVVSRSCRAATLIVAAHNIHEVRIYELSV